MKLMYISVMLKKEELISEHRKYTCGDFNKYLFPQIIIVIKYLCIQSTKK